MTRCMSPVEVLPGGAVDPGEGTHAAGLRELYEETGLAPSSTKLPPGPFAMWEVRSVRRSAPYLFGICSDQRATDWQSNFPFPAEPWAAAVEAGKRTSHLGLTKGVAPTL